MGWLKNLFRTVPKEEMEGIHLDTTQPYWETIGPRGFTELFKALQGWLPPNAVLYFEGGSPDAEINDFMANFSIPEQTHVAMGTIWPRPKVFHVPATEAVLKKLTSIMEHHAEPELAVHFHVYQDNTVLLEWDDAFDQSLLISGSILEETVKVFADKIGEKYWKVVQEAGFIRESEKRNIPDEGPFGGLRKLWPDLFGPDGKDVKLVHYNYGDGRGGWMFKHIPTGLSVYRDTSKYSVFKVRDEMLEELRVLVRQRRMESKTGSDAKINPGNP